MNVTVALEPTELDLGPGDSGHIEVTIGNASSVIEHYTVAVNGLPQGDTVETAPEVCKLHPGETGRIDLTINCDPQYPPAAGRTVLGVLVTSPYRPEVIRCEELVLHTRAVPALSMAVRPEVIAGRGARADLAVVNDGNTALDVELGGSDPEGAVRLWFSPPRIRLQPRDQATVRVEPHARRPLSGTEVRRQITLLGKSADVEASTSLVFVQRPLVAGGMLRLAAAAAGVAVMAAAIIAAAVIGVRAIAKPGNGNTPASSAPRWHISTWL